MAKVGINHPIHVTNDTPSELIMDVGQMFYVLFAVGLALNAVTTFQSLLMCFMSENYSSCNMAFSVIVVMMNLVFLVSVTLMRYSHEGRVCSGDYLFMPITLETRYESVLGIEGQFLEVYVIAGWL